jgi:ATP-binding protein involved in chromosome partitioning
MLPPDHDTIMRALESVRDDAEGKDIVSLGMISGLQIDNQGGVIFMIEVDPARGPAMEPLRQRAEDAVRKLPGVKKVTAVLTAQKKSAPAAKPSATSPPDVRAALTPHVKNIVVVASGKGGVGKSTLSTNLSIFLSKNVQKIGLLDADIYGPSIPRMTGLLDKKPTQSEDGKIIPLEAYGLKVMSIGFMMDASAPLIWRGPMIQSALLQLVRDVQWGTADDPLDILVIDMPPGTGDAQLTLVQKVAVSGAIIVSTPQDIALIDARKGLEMFRKTDIPILGIVENMSLYVCPNCGHEAHIFGHGGAKAEAEKLGCPFLGEIPLHIDIRMNSDAGEPIIANNKNENITKAFDNIAQKVIKALEPKTA